MSDDVEPVRPINLSGGAVRDETGYLIVCLNRQAEQNIRKFLETYALQLAGLITSVKPADLDILDQNYVGADKRGLGSYYRIDVRKLGDTLPKVEELLRKVPGVDLVYREKAASDPSSAGSTTFEHLQTYLGPAPRGIDAHFAWQKTNGRGTGMSFVDIEQGWLHGHPDLPLALPPICNDNRDDGLGTNRGDHGSAVLGIVAAVNNATGVIGIASELLSVATASSFRNDCPGVYVADALAKILASSSPLPDVVLIEAQLGTQQLPVETDPAIVKAIQALTRANVIVVEAAGNGGNDIDAWVDPTGRHTLNRTIAGEFVETDAILVGAAHANTINNQHVRSNFSNHGSRIDCYGWGDSIVTTGYGDLDGNGTAAPYTRTFGGTSGAAPMVAGAALLVQSILVGNGKAKLTPKEMRNVLSDPATGTPQHPSKAGNIGVMPNLRLILDQLLP